MARKNDDKIVYDEEVFKIGVELYRKCEIPVDMIYHLIKSKRLRSFSAILVQSDRENFGDFLHRNKRKTDFLFPVNDEKSIYAMLCQETQVDGGFYFIKRLEGLMGDDGPHGILAAIVAVESAHYSVRDLIFFMLDTYLKALADEENDIVFRTIR